MPSFLYNDLTQLMPKILEPRYETLYFENGDLIPTQTDLIPGAREIAYERFSEFGDADFVSDATTNIPIVDISIDEDRYPIYMLASGFPLSLQEQRAYNHRSRGGTTPSTFNRYERRMAAARKVVAMRTNRATSMGYMGQNLNFPGMLTNAIVPTVNSAFDMNSGTFNTILDFMIATIESLTDNFVSMEPTELLLPPNVRKKMLSTYNTNGTKTVMQALDEQYPDLEVQKIRETSATALDAVGTIPNRVTGKDRLMLYPKESSVLNRHIESSVAELAPEEFIRTDGLRRIYPMFSCITPTIFDYPQDCRYVDIVKVN
jgi:hypothetical protein